MTLRPLQVLGFLLLLLELPAGAIEFGPRTWTSADGRELQAQLISADDTAAQLKLTTTGKTVPVPLTSLSDGDLAYIAEWIEARKTYWGIEVLSAEYPSSYRTEPTGAGTTRQTIKPMMGKPDDILILLTLKVTPPPGRARIRFRRRRNEIQSLDRGGRPCRGRSQVHRPARPERKSRRRRLPRAPDPLPGPQRRQTRREQIQGKSHHRAVITASRRLPWAEGPRIKRRIFGHHP